MRNINEKQEYMRRNSVNSRKNEQVVDDLHKWSF